MTGFSALTNELSGPAALHPDDLLCITDVSDTTESVDGTTHKVKVKNLGFPVILQRITHTTASGEFDFTSLPSGYKRFIIRGSIEHQTSATDELYLYFNGNFTGSDYHTQVIRGQNNTLPVGEASTAQVGFCADTATVSRAHYLHIVIENPDSAELKHAFGITSNAPNTAENIINLGMCVHKTMTTAVTRITLDPGGNVKGELTLYGEA